MKRFDVIIVGAGPAGATAGYWLGKAGLDVLIIDKSTFPRRKICGGGLTQRAFSEIPFDISPVIHQEVNCGYIAFRGQSIKTIRVESPVAYMIDRLSFDNLLLEKAVAQGVRAELGQRVKSIAEQKEHIKLQTDQNTFTCRYLIGADGVHSLVAQQSNLVTNRKTSLAYEARLIKTNGPEPFLTDTITFDFGTLFFGYGWIFPKRDHLNIGVCRTWPANRASKKHLLRFIDQHPALHKDRIIDIRAYPVPQGTRKAFLHKNKILLVGDAANLGDPWLGEGLYYALYSGRIAGETIIKHAQGALLDLSEYSQHINNFCFEQFTYAKRFSLLVNALPYINVSLLKASRTLQNMIIGLLSGERTYRETWHA
ncbi:MAG: geranylgeranyl reductase family protein, partial [Chloroflexota bacterium]|nr:geranylgeranyl reductase family protein [Chloroflexota bacterium]